MCTQYYTQQSFKNEQKTKEKCKTQNFISIATQSLFFVVGWYLCMVMNSLSEYHGDHVNGAINQ